MSDSTLPLRRLLSDAILNDNRGGVVSEADARALVDAALEALSGAQDPAALHAEQQRFIVAARALVGGDPDAATLLDGYARRAARLLTPSEAPESDAPQSFPEELWEAFVTLAEDDEALGELDGALERLGAEPQGEAWSFTWAAGSQRGVGWGLPWQGGWVLAPEAIAPEAIALARDVLTAALQADWIASGMFDAAALAELRPWHALWPDQEDPTGLGLRHPIVLRFNNPFGSDHGLYVGVDLDAQAGRAEVFN
ncbi:MAG: hypothetical protein H6741_22935 [Alphaproteobacteria bacterium]|nr:hypothetical protein [Alphaproteobacteria bacterium]